MLLEQMIDWPHYIRMREIADRCGVHPGLIDRFIRLGLLEPVGRDALADEWFFEIETISLVRKILRLRNELGVNYSGVGVVLECLSSSTCC